MTDFENAAFTVFIVLVSRIILYFDLNLYVPISKIDENMRRAQQRDACAKGKFWFSQSLMPACGGCPARKLPRERVAHLFGAGQIGPEECSILEILTGKGTYRGLCPMIMAYLDVIGADSITLRTVSTYLDFIVARAAGQLMTPAAWMRKVRAWLRLALPRLTLPRLTSPRLASPYLASRCLASPCPGAAVLTVAWAPLHSTSARTPTTSTTRSSPRGLPPT